MRLIKRGFAAFILAGVMVQGGPAPAQPADSAQAAPAAPYRRCSSGRFASIGSSCALVAANGQPPALMVKIERNLPARPAALILIWSEREGLGGEMLRLTPPSFADASSAAGAVLSVTIPLRFCRPNARRFTVELEVEGGRNVGEIGRFSFPCAH